MTLKSKTKTDPISKIEYRIPTPIEARQLMAEGRELRRLLAIQLKPMSEITPAMWFSRCR
jgi:hypothetical protein